MADAPPKPEVGTVAPVQVVSPWKHPLTLILSAIAVIPTVLAALIQLQALPGLPTNVMGWIASTIAVLTVLVTVLRNLGLLGPAAVTQQQAAKLIQTDVPK